eukprot:COSAG04_NODE_1476_length_6578_cov_2.265010_8_plen_98_part_00
MLRARPAALLLLLARLLLLLLPASSALPIPIGGAGCGRKYEGIGGLLNSDAPWLRGYPEPQRSDILDVLFKPQWCAPRTHPRRSPTLPHAPPPPSRV